MAAKDGDEWILGRIKEYEIQSGIYTVMDEDDNTKTYELPESHVIALDSERLAKAHSGREEGGVHLVW